MANTFSNTTRAADTGTGLFTARSYSARNALPVAGVRLTLTGEDGTKWTAETGEDGLFSALPLACPPRSLSLDEANTQRLSLIHISEPTRQAEISYAVFCLKKKKKKKTTEQNT